MYLDVYTLFFCVYGWPGLVTWRWWGSANCEPMLPNCCLFFPLHDAAPSAWNDGPCPPTRPTLLIIILKNIYLYNCLVFDSSVVCVSVFTYPSLFYFIFSFHVSCNIRTPDAQLSFFFFFITIIFYHWGIQTHSLIYHHFLRPTGEVGLGRRRGGRLVLFDVRCVSAIFLA